MTTIKTKNSEEFSYTPPHHLSPKNEKFPSLLTVKNAALFALGFLGGYFIIDRAVSSLKNIPKPPTLLPMDLTPNGISSKGILPSLAVFVGSTGFLFYYFFFQRKAASTLEDEQEKTCKGDLEARGAWQQRFNCVQQTGNIEFKFKDKLSIPLFANFTGQNLDPIQFKINLNNYIQEAWKKSKEKEINSIPRIIRESLTKLMAFYLSQKITGSLVFIIGNAFWIASLGDTNVLIVDKLGFMSCKSEEDKVISIKKILLEQLFPGRKKLVLASKKLLDLGEEAIAMKVSSLMKKPNEEIAQQLISAAESLYSKSDELAAMVVDVPEIIDCNQPPARKNIFSIPLNELLFCRRDKKSSLLLSFDDKIFIVWPSKKGKLFLADSSGLPCNNRGEEGYRKFKDANDLSDFFHKEILAERLIEKPKYLLVEKSIEELKNTGASLYSPAESILQKAGLVKTRI